jgi:hypothetical protein
MFHAPEVLTIHANDGNTEAPVRYGHSVDSGGHGSIDSKSAAHHCQRKRHLFVWDDPLRTHHRQTALSKRGSVFQLASTLVLESWHPNILDYVMPEAIDLIQDCRAVD